MAHILQRNRTLGRKFSQQDPSIDKPFANVCADMGGATLHLGGGDYTISAPIVIPCHVCNMRIHGGTLRASNSFPQNSSFLIESGQSECGADNLGAPEFVGFSELMLDGRLRRGPSVIMPPHSHLY